MSRGIVAYCLLAIVCGPLARLGESAERLTETLTEQDHAHILESGDAERGCCDISSSPHDQRHDLGIPPAVVGRLLSFSDLSAPLPSVGHRAGGGAWPDPDGSRRRSWLQVFRI